MCSEGFKPPTREDVGDGQLENMALIWQKPYEQYG
jgi:hypothetical protein